MKAIPSYGKIFTLGSPRTENALIGEIIIQEKIDGSQFGFGLNEDNEITIRSKGKVITDQPDTMFKQGWEYIFSIEEKLKLFAPDTYFRGEYLKSPKHNTLVYGRIPKNHIILFDAFENNKFVSRERLEKMGKILDLEVVPELFKGLIKTESNTLEFIKEIISSSKSCLQGDFGIEGVVIKNYNQWVELGGQVMPLFTKYVQERFKERNHAEWKDKKPKGKLQDFIDGFKTEGRFMKAFQHLRDSNELENELRDIPKLVNEVHKDIMEEDKEYIKQFLYKCYIDDIKRTSVRGLAEWYKEKLIKDSFNEF